MILALILVLECGYCRSVSFVGYAANHSQNAATLVMINWNYVWIPLVIYAAMYVVLNLYDEQRILDAVEK